MRIVAHLVDGTDVTSVDDELSADDASRLEELIEKVLCEEHGYVSFATQTGKAFFPKASLLWVEFITTELPF